MDNVEMLLNSMFKSMNNFNEEEIKIIRDMIEIHKRFRNIDFSIRKGDRVRKTYNIDKLLTDKVSKLAYEKNITDSDMMNIITKEFFKNG